MAEILFKGKNTKNRVWIEGCLLEYIDNITGGVISLIAPRRNPEYGDPVPIEDCFVDPVTIGQHVFLDDFWMTWITNNGERYVIDFVNGGFGLFSMKEYLDRKYQRSAVVIFNGLSELQTACFVNQNLRVVGNIQDEPPGN